MRRGDPVADRSIGGRTAVRPFRYLPPMSTEPPRRRRLRVPQVRRAPADPLVPLGRRGLRRRPRAGPPGPARHRRGLVPLVPRDGRRVVRESGAGRVPERALRLHQGGPGRAARRRRPLPAGGAGADPPGRLAADGVPHARRARCSTAAPTSRPTACTAGPGFRTVLESVLDAYRSRRGQVHVAGGGGAARGDRRSRRGRARRAVARSCSRTR